MKNLLQNQAIKILQRPKSLTIFSKDYECAPLLHQPTGKHKTQRTSEVGKQGLEVSRCTPPVIESCIPTIRHYQDALSHSKPIPMDWQIHKKVIQFIWSTYSNVEVNLFAIRQTTHFPMWFTESNFEPRMPGSCLFLRLLPTRPDLLFQNSSYLAIMPMAPGSNPRIQTCSFKLL